MFLTGFLFLIVDGKNCHHKWLSGYSITTITMQRTCGKTPCSDRTRLKVLEHAIALSIYMYMYTDVAVWIYTYVYAGAFLGSKQIQRSPSIYMYMYTDVAVWIYTYVYAGAFLGSKQIQRSGRCTCHETHEKGTHTQTCTKTHSPSLSLYVYSWRAE